MHAQTYEVGQDVLSDALLEQLAADRENSLQEDVAAAHHHMVSLVAFRLDGS